MCNWFRNWRRARAKARWEERRERGFEYVMVSYHLRGHPIDYIEDTVYEGSWTRDDGFGQGVREALRLLPEE